MFSPTFTNIVGYYPQHENEIMLSRFILEAMNIDNPEVGMEIEISFILDDTEEIVTEIFTLACIYTEYVNSRHDGPIAIYSSRNLAEKYDTLTPDNISVNVIFTDTGNINENIEKLRHDLSFTDSQEYIQSPVFNENYGNMRTYITLLAIIIFLMFTGYLLVYNVMYISVSKDVRFYGMLKTLGTTAKQIRRIVIGQVIRLCCISLPIGCLVSAVVSLFIIPAVISNSGIDTGAIVSFSPIIYIGAIMFSFLTALLGATTSAKKAANITPIEAFKFTGEIVDKKNMQYVKGGKSYKLMAIRNIFRERKRAIIVLLSLFLSIVIFTTIITIVNSIDIDNYVNAEYDYDYSFASNTIGSYALNEEFLNEIKDLTGVTEVSTTTMEGMELMYSEMLDTYIQWINQEYNLTKEDVIEDNAFRMVHGIKGIDSLELKQINETLTTSIDIEAFERGEIALFNILFDDMYDSFTDVSSIDIRLGSDKQSVQLDVGGIITMQPTHSMVHGYSDFEIIVSNEFLQKYYPNLDTLYLHMDVESDYDAQIYNILNEMVDEAGVSMVSRYAARITMRDNKITMLVLGGGASLILGLIGVFNFINVMSVGVIVHKREFAILESMGMNKKQLLIILSNEGLGYAIITILCALTFGNIIVFGLFMLFKSVADFAQFTYPYISIAIMYVIISLICYITPKIAYRSINQATLVERLREVE